MPSFNDLGLREPLLRVLEDEGIEYPTALQQATVPVLRREGNLVARAGSGAGKTLAYGLGVLDRIGPRAGGGEEAEEGTAGGIRVLVLTPTAEAAERAALELVTYAHALELSLTASGGGWGTPAGEADVLIATPGEVMEAVRSSGVKLEGVEALVVDGAAEIEALGGWEALETIFDHLPRDAQRVVFTTAMSDAVEDLVGRRVKRAMRFPPEPAVPDEAEAAPAPTGTVGYVPVSGEKVDVVARLLGGGRGGETAPVLFCRTDERASEVAEALALRGFLVGDPDDADADVAVLGATTPDEVADETGERPGTVISFDVPADSDALRARHGGGETGFVLVEPRELTHLRMIAERAGVRVQPAGIAGEEPASAPEIRAFRSQLRRAIREEDLGAQMLLLEPLFEDYTAAEVAAALSVLLRRKAPVAPEPAPARPATAQVRREAAQSGLDVGPAPSAFARLFVSIGERDGIRTGDLVGAIAGEADISGKSIGKIEIRDTFSIVEVPADAAERVIRALNGTSIRGRSVRVDFDRGADRARRGPGGRPGPGGPGRGGPARRPVRREQREPRGE